MSKNIAIVAHKYLTQPDDDLVIYLNKNKYKNVLHIRHSFNEAEDRCSYYTWYRDGAFCKEERSRDYKNWPEPLIYLKELFYTVKWVVGSKLVWDYYIGMDGLCTLSGELLKFIKKVEKTVYWVIDFVPGNRFDSELKNRIYKFINVSGYKNSDEVWDLSPRMAEARENLWGIPKSIYKVQKVVPYGVWRDRIKKYSYTECERTTLVYMGILIPKQGVQLVIQALPQLIKNIPGLKFKIIGGGEYRIELKNLASSLGVGEYCDFKGKIEEVEVLEAEIAKSCVAIAPYIKSLDTWTYYADPGKIKKYLACGVPPVLTDLPWMSKQIRDSNAGIVIEENIENIVDAVTKLMQPEINDIYRKNAVEFSASFDYNVIFSSLFT